MAKTTINQKELAAYKDKYNSLKNNLIKTLIYTKLRSHNGNIYAPTLEQMLSRALADQPIYLDQELQDLFDEMQTKVAYDS